MDHTLHQIKFKVINQLQQVIYESFVWERSLWWNKKYQRESHYHPSNLWKSYRMYKYKKLELHHRWKLVEQQQKRIMWLDAFIIDYFFPCVHYFIFFVYKYSIEMKRLVLIYFDVSFSNDFWNRFVYDIRLLKTYLVKNQFLIWKIVNVQTIILLVATWDLIFIKELSHYVYSFNRCDH